MPYTTTAQREREKAAARAMDVDKEEEIDLARLNEILRLKNPPVEDLAGGEELVEEPEPEPEGQMDDHENDPHRLNHGEGRRKKVTLCEFYSFLMSIWGYFNNVLAGGSLTQQWTVDSHAKIEANHVNPKAMKQAYQDAMAICSKFGNPVFFLTFTAVAANIPSHLSAPDRPDIIARVFQQKKIELVNDIEKRQMLGFATARIHVIEFQKRGLPHCHMLICIDERDAPATAEDVDATICVEIPDRITHLRLHKSVMAHMIHGPQETLLNDNGYPTYRRRDTEVVHRLKRGRTHFEVDNRWVVPYNPWLSLNFDSHTNLKYCASIVSVKYIFKYVYKGYVFLHSYCLLQVSGMLNKFLKHFELFTQLSRHIGEVDKHPNTCGTANKSATGNDPLTSRLQISLESTNLSNCNKPELQEISQMSGWPDCDYHREECRRKFNSIMETTRSKIEEASYNAQLIRNISLIISDEATMKTNHALDQLPPGNFKYLQRLWATSAPTQTEYSSHCHSSQEHRLTKVAGKTFERVGIYLLEYVFSYGQLCVAFSRATSREGVKSQCEKTEKQGKLLRILPKSTPELASSSQKNRKQKITDQVIKTKWNHQTINHQEELNSASVYRPNKDTGRALGAVPKCTQP
ncbi:ATP-dependent Helicase-like protein [Daphnia magna]|uniref:ATP-dependent Helicase-like protein n=1 Tax=Daphnia magna TaxID=35525 RepID=A0A164P2V4_9CRUS|nr:ATP-dependent Helicase-like protein [Daphnia magna]